MNTGLKLTSLDGVTCPNCGSDRYMKQLEGPGVVKYKFKCNNCLSYFTEEEITKTEDTTNKKPCVCEMLNLELGDTLYFETSWDGGIEYAYIHNIKYCPVCGKELKEGE